MTAEEIYARIEQEKVTAEKYLLAGAGDKSSYSQAVAFVEGRLTENEKCLLAARREIERHRKYKSRRHWVIKTQFMFNQLAEKKKLENTWISESKIKREWRELILQVTEIAVRLEYDKLSTK